MAIIVSKTTSDLAWDGGFSASNVIPAGVESEIKATIITGSPTFMIGFSSTNPDNNFATISRAIFNRFIAADQSVRVYQSGTLIYTSASGVGGSPGDVISVHRSAANVVTYRVNGSVVYTGTALAGNVVIDNSFYFADGIPVQIGLWVSGAEQAIIVTASANLEIAATGNTAGILQLNTQSMRF